MPDATNQNEWDDDTSEIFISYLMEKTGRPITGLDFASLYPHLIMTYNLSPEFIISKETSDGSFEKMRDIAMQAVQNNHDLHKINFTYGDTNILGYSVRHDNNMNSNNQIHSTEESNEAPNSDSDVKAQFGIYPTLLKELYDKRSILKKPKLYYEILKEHFEKLNDNATQNNKIVEFIKKNNLNQINQSFDALIELEPAFLYAKEICDVQEMLTFTKKESIDSILMDDAVDFVVQKLGMINTTENINKIREILNHDNDELTFDDVELYFAYYDSKQKALKVMMNTLYGESGNKISPFYILTLAGGITSAGQYNLDLISNACKDLKCSVKYGDSVTGDTPIPVGNKQYYSYKNIEDLFDDRKSIKILDKEIYIPKDLFVWSDEGFTKIKKVIRHKTTKKMYRILTHTGSVDVTEDHSLLDQNGEKIKPSECEVGTELLHKDLPRNSDLSEYSDSSEYSNMISKEEAYAFGLFMANGSCGTYNCKSEFKYSWAINNQNKDYLNRAIIGMKKSIYCQKFKILNTMSYVYKLVPCGNSDGMVKFMVEDFRSMFYHNKTKIVPTVILKSSKDIQTDFLEGYYDGDNNKDKNFKLYSKYFDLKGKLGAATMYKLCINLGYACSINCRTDKPNIFRLTITKGKMRKHPNKIKKIIPLSSPDTSGVIDSINVSERGIMVYDLETENHHFAAGIGRMIVHNTDSVYITVPESYFANIDSQYFGGKISKIQYCTELVNITFIEIKKINKLINIKLVIDNGTKFLRLEYEEVLFPVVLISKKKYYGLPHISTPNFNTNRTPFTRGIEMNKRGVSDILKRVYGDKILIESLSIYNKKELMELVYEAIHYFYESVWTINDFVKTAIYKPKTREEILEGKGNKSVLVFVKRMNYRGVDVKPFERFKYIIVKKYPKSYNYRGCQEKLKVGDRMEFLEHVEKFNVDIDKDYYMNGNIITQLARILIYRSEFHIEADDSPDGSGGIDDAIKKANEKMVKLAVKHLTEFISEKGFYDQYQEVGMIKKAIFRKSESIIIDKFSKMIRVDKMLISFIFKDWNLDSTKSFRNIYTKTENKIIKQTADYGSEFIRILIKIENRKPKKKRRNKLNLIMHLRKLYGNRSCKYIELYTNFKNKYIHKAERDFRNLFKYVLTITTEYRDTIDIMANIIEQILEPILVELYKPISTASAEYESFIDNSKKYIKMSVDELAALCGKTKIPYDFLNELAEDTIYNLINSGALDIVNKVIEIQHEISYILTIYYQSISIQNAINTYNDKKNKVNLVVYDKPEIITNHRTELIDETCTDMKNIGFY